MNYTKPEITSLASASLVIQGSPSGSPKTVFHINDYLDIDYATPAAYEADE
ncbi:MAG: hypothetical protein ABSD89_06120 [Halobacteriota archaeon]|jgi:hypothetical protein